MVDTNGHRGARYQKIDYRAWRGDNYSSFKGRKNSNLSRYDKSIGRKQSSPQNAGHVFKGHDPPNCPARNTFYIDDIPKFFPGQPGYKSYLQKIEEKSVKKKEPNDLEKSEKAPQERKI